MMQLSLDKPRTRAQGGSTSSRPSGSESLPIEKDAIGGPYFLSGLAEIEAQTGETDEAVGNLRQLLSIPAGAFRFDSSD